jgi:hypothetical protein
MASINIDNKNGQIITSDDAIVKIGNKGAILLGNGEYLEEENGVDLSKYAGAMRFNKERKCLQVCDGTVWKDIKGPYKQTSNIVWSMLF